MSQVRGRRLHTHGCGALWSNAVWAHCAGCHRTFAGTASFDAHRSWVGGGRVCADPVAAGFAVVVDRWTGGSVFRVVRGEGL